MLESISDLKMWLWYSDPGGQNAVRLLTIAAQYKFKKSSYKQVFYRDSHGEHTVPVNVKVLIVKMCSTNQSTNLLLLDDPGHVKSKWITRNKCCVSDTAV